MTIVQEIMLRSKDYLLRIIAPVGGQGGVTMSYLCALQQFPFGRLRLAALWGKILQSFGAQFVEKSNDWKETNRLLVVQTEDSIEQAKVFKAHAVLQGL